MKLKYKQFHNTIKLIGLLSLIALPFTNDTQAQDQMTQNVSPKECVILLHGLARSDGSLEKMEQALKADGFHIINVDYPSREYTIETLAETYISKAVKNCESHEVEKIHFVTHSMGGILVRYYLSQHQLDKLGRVVMLSPPNQGSEVVDNLGDFPGYYALNGPAGQQLGTEPSSLPNTLGAVDYPVGIITGNKSINLILSLYIPGEDDGKVSVERAKVEGMTDFLVLPHTHPLIMDSDETIRQTIHFLRNETFDKKAEH